MHVFARPMASPRRRRARLPALALMNLARLIPALLALLALPVLVVGAERPVLPDGAWYEGKSQPPPGWTPTGRTGLPVPDPRQLLFDVRHYDLWFYIDPEIEYIWGRTSLEFVPYHSGLQEIVLDFLNTMTVTSVFSPSLGGTRDYDHADDLLVVDLEESLGVGEKHTLYIYFEGLPQPEGFMGFEFTTLDNGSPLAATVSEPWSARSWWPCKDVASDKATFSVNLSVPEGLKAVSNGALVNAPDQGGGRAPVAATDDPFWQEMVARASGGKDHVIYSWYESLPISTYHFSLAVTDYEVLEDIYMSGGDTLVIQHYVYPELVGPATADFAVLPEMLAFCEEKFGRYPFPGEKYGMALVEYGGAMEHPTATSFGSLLVTGDGYFESIILHELAHQWFGNKVTPRDWTHTWLSEGFATYAEALWAEHTGGGGDLQEFMRRRSHFEVWNDPLVRYDTSSNPWYYFNNMVYYKGAWVLHMLRRLIGDEDFFASLQLYLRFPYLSYGTAVSEFFVIICGIVTQEDLAWFFDQWLYWEVYPLYEVYIRNHVPSGFGPVDIILHQVQEPDPVYGDVPFQMYVDLQLSGAGLDTVVTVFNDQRLQTFTFELKEPVDQVVMDPGGWYLHRHTVMVDVPQAGTVTPARLISAAPNPFNPHCLIRWDTTLATRDALSVYDVQGRRITTRSWPLRQAGPRQFVWQGRDDTGRACASGVYLFEITCRGGDVNAGVQPGLWRLAGKVTLHQ